MAFAATRTVYLSLWLFLYCIVECMVFRILAIMTVISCCVLTLVLFTTTPSTIGPAGMLGVFVLGYLSLLGVVTFLLYYGERLGAILLRVLGFRPGRIHLSLGRAYLYASVFAALPMMAIGLYSTGGIAWYEFLLLILFGLIGVVYIAKRS